MYQLSNIKNVLALTTMLFFFSACTDGGGSTTYSVSSGSTSDSVSDGSTSDSVSDGSTLTSIQSSKATLKGRVKDKDTGKGLGHVKVSIGESTTTTDADGNFELSNLNESDSEIVTFESEGYVDSSVAVKIDEPSEDNTASSNYLEVSMDGYDSESYYMSQDDIVIDATNGATISILSSTEYVDDSGKIFNGNITAQASYINVTTETGREVFPGEYEGVDTSGSIVLFVSYGAISFTLQDDSGNQLDLSGIATITFPSLGLPEQDIIPLWYYDYDQGLWVEEGYAELQEDGTYQGEISYSGIWSLNKPIEEAPGIYRSRIVDENGDPATTVKVHAIGSNWIRTDLSTDENGEFEIEVIPGSTFKLKAYHYVDQYEAVYDGTLPAITSGEILEDY